MALSIYDLRLLLYNYFGNLFLVIIVPDKRSRILEVVIVRPLITWGSGNLEGGGFGKG